MKKIAFLFISTTFLFQAKAQVNTSLLPASSLMKENSLSPIKETVLPPFNLANAKQADITDANNGELPKFSRSVFTNITLDNSGSWTNLPNGDRIWRLQITSKGAQALLPYYNKFYLPQGATFHVYTPDKDEIIGAFTSDNNPSGGYYATGLIHGESCILEYYEPHEVRGKGIISLNEIGHAYRWVNSYFPKKRTTQNDTLGFQQSDACEVNVNCSEGAAWQNQKRSVVCMIVQSSLGQGACSGSLINTVRQDCTPYMLGAQHCSEGVSANQYSQFLFYFNFESPNCNTPDSIGTLGNEFIAGCTKISDSNDNGGDNGSDFLLLQLNNPPPSAYNVYYAGWSNQNVASDSGVCIHHPAADLKKISTYLTPLVDTTWLTVPHTHWRVQWAATTHGHGVTEGGSSGSPLFNIQGQIVGTLTGGDSYCSTPDEYDYFGKIAYDWTSNGTATNRQLKPWLDPDNTGAISINGRNADCVLGVNEVKADDINLSVLPNPSSGKFALLFETNDEKTLSVYDITGKLLKQSKAAVNDLILNLQSFSNGVYILVAENKNGRATKRLVLNH